MAFTARLRANQTAYKPDYENRTCRYGQQDKYIEQHKNSPLYQYMDRGGWA